jgi:antitoxin Phd
MKTHQEPLLSRSERRSRSYSATETKNEFGKILERAIQGEMVVITKHDAPKAVLMSMENFNSLANASTLQLDSLSSEFDALFARMQTPHFNTAMDAAFHASPEELGKAAVAFARQAAMDVGQHKTSL